MFDGKAFGDEMVSVVRGYVDRVIGPLAQANADLTARNAALEARLEALEARDVAGDILPRIDAMARAVEALPGAPDLSGFATKEDVAEVRAAIPPAVEIDMSPFTTSDHVERLVSEGIAAGLAAYDAMVPDLSGFATAKDVAEALDDVRAAIPPVADMSGFATKADIDALRDAIPVVVEPKDFGPEIDAVRAAIPALPDAPDLSGFATKEDVAEVRAAIPTMPEALDLSGFASKDDVAAAVAGIVIPEAIKGDDADPEAVAEIVIGRLEERLAEVDRLVDVRLAAVKDGEPGPQGEPGKDGTFPIVREWADGVHYAGEIVTHNGGTWQARADTGREPGHHADWVCLAAPGAEGRSVNVCGTYDEGDEYRYLDIVALNGGSFIALRDAPGECPGDGWQLLAGRGKPGQAIKGDPGPQGDPGKDAAEVVGVYRSGDEIVVTFADGREMRA